MKITEDQENKIKFSKDYIQRLKEIEELEYNKILGELEASGLAKEFGSEEQLDDWLFDYIYNGEKYSSFTEYLKSYGKGDE